MEATQTLLFFARRRKLLYALVQEGQLRLDATHLTEKQALVCGAMHVRRHQVQKEKARRRDFEQALHIFGRDGLWIQGQGVLEGLA